MSEEHCSRCGAPLKEKGVYAAVRIKSNLIRNWFSNNKEFNEALAHAYTHDLLLCLKCAREPIEAIAGGDAE